VSRKDMNPDELARLRSQLPLEEPVQKEVDISGNILRVTRFDSDIQGDDLSTDSLLNVPEGYGEENDDEHEHTFDDGECAVCGEPEPETQPTKPVRRKRSGKGVGDETAHIRAAEAY